MAFINTLLQQGDLCGESDSTVLTVSCQTECPNNLSTRSISNFSFGIPLSSFQLFSVSAFITVVGLYPIAESRSSPYSRYPTVQYPSHETISAKTQTSIKT